MKHGYVSEKLGSATRGMASGQGDARQRLLAAFHVFHTLSAEDFPKELQVEWKGIMESLTSKGPVYDSKDEPIIGSVENTMRNISLEAAEEIAKRVVNLYDEVKSSKP